MSSFTLNLNKAIRSKIRRAYCIWAISKKKKASDELTDFEKSFVVLFKRIVLLKTTNLQYAGPNNARIAHNLDKDLIFILQGSSVKVNSPNSTIHLVVDQETQSYLNTIFDRASAGRARKLEEAASRMSMSALKSIESGHEYSSSK